MPRRRRRRMPRRAQVGRNSFSTQLLKMVRDMFRLGLMELDNPVTQDMLTALLEVGFAGLGVGGLGQRRAQHSCLCMRVP